MPEPGMVPEAVKVVILFSQRGQVQPDDSLISGVGGFGECPVSFEFPNQLCHAGAGSPQKCTDIADFDPVVGFAQTVRSRLICRIGSHGIAGWIAS